MQEELRRAGGAGLQPPQDPGQRCGAGDRPFPGLGLGLVPEPPPHGLASPAPHPPAERDSAEERHPPHRIPRPNPAGDRGRRRRTLLEVQRGHRDTLTGTGLFLRVHGQAG
ncbi:hypothetical protein Nmel_013929 [Mimus melanotis]